MSGYRGGEGAGDVALPNEMRISIKGSSFKYAETACRLLDQGFEHVKLVGRGQAAPMTEEIAAILRKRAHNCSFKTTMNSAFNKNG